MKRIVFTFVVYLIWHSNKTNQKKKLFHFRNSKVFLLWQKYNLAINAMWIISSHLNLFFGHNRNFIKIFKSFFTNSFFGSKKKMKMMHLDNCWCHKSEERRSFKWDARVYNPFNCQYFFGFVIFHSTANASGHGNSVNRYLILSIVSTHQPAQRQNINEY